MSVETTAQEILKEIESYITDDISIIDALVHYAEKNDIEIELVGEIIRRSPVLKLRVQEDAEKLNLMEKVARLPI